MSIDKKQAQMPQMRKYNEMLEDEGIPSEENLDHQVQGHQGSQTKYSGNNAFTSKDQEKDTGYTFDPNQTQTNALLDVNDARFNLFLQQLYYNPKCQYFYICLLVFSFLLILITIIDGFKVAQTGWFIMLEFILNLMIGLDLGFRIKLAGFRKYFVLNDGSQNWWSIFDAFVVSGCILFFIITLIHQSEAVQSFEEVSEEALLVTWSVWQTMRMIVIVKKQRQAQQSAKTLIDFTNIMVETDFGQASARGGGEHDEIIFEAPTNVLANKEKLSDEYRYSKNGSKVRQRKRSGQYSTDKQADGGVELSDLTSSQKNKGYRLDDNSEMPDQQNEDDSKTNSAREIVFDPDEI